MKTKLVATIAMAGLLTTGLYAANTNEDIMQKNMNKGDKSCKMHSGKHKMMKKGMHKRGDKGPLAILKELNLTKVQKKDIAQAKKDLRKNRLTPDVAFTKDGFDKAKFIEIMKQKRDNMLESKAEMIDRVYKILTPKQKEQFKVLMELKKEKRAAKMEKRMNRDTNSNGRG